MARVFSSPAFPLWLVALMTVVAAYVGWDAWVRGRHVLEVSEIYGVTVNAPAASKESPTGYADGRRSLVMPPGAADTAHWIMQTQEMFARGTWRIRRTEADNAPDGREVHWAIPLHGWLGALAWADHAISGRPIGQSVERAVIYSGPVMLALFLVLLTPWLVRRFGGMAGIFLLAGLVATYPFYLDFTPGYADHHGLANICGLLTVLFLAAGAADETTAGARRWFTASALAGGCGLWISAATAVPVLIGIGLGLLVGAWLGRKARAGVAWLTQPDFLRRWSRVGAGMSLVAWLLEYFPSHLGIRLEVNHPLYALAWLGAGEVLRAAALASRDGFVHLAPRDRSAGLTGLALMSGFPIVVVATSAKTFFIADPFLWRLHAQYISEFQGLGRILARGFNANLVSLWLPMLLLLAPLWRLGQSATPPRTKALLAMAWVPAVVGLCMGWNQIRWLGLAFALSVPAMAVFFREDAIRNRRAWAGRLLVIGLAFAPGIWTTVHRTRVAADTTTDDIHNLALRDVGHWLRLWAGSERVVVLASPTTTTKLMLYGGHHGVGTLYWENLAGLRNSAALLAATSDEAARAIATRLGVTHVVFVSWEAFETSLIHLQRNLPEQSPLPTDAFALRLLSSPVPPPWLQALPFKLPKHVALDGAQVRIWKVVPEQTPAAAVARAVNYYLELGQLENAARLAPALLEHERELSAMVMLAAVASRDGDREGFGAALSQVLGRLSQAPGLALDEHIHLVVVLAVGQRADLARAQLRACMAKLDEPALRQLSVGTLTDLLTLSDALNVPLPSPALGKLAHDLLPPK